MPKPPPKAPPPAAPRAATWPEGTTPIGVHRGAVDALAIGPEGQLISAARDGRVVSWPAKGKPPTTLLQLPSDHWVKPSRLVALPGRAGLLVGTSSTRLVHLTWSGATSDIPLDFDDSGLIDIAVAPGGTALAVSGDSNKVRLIGLDGAVRWRGESYKWTYSVAFSPSGDKLIAATWDGHAYPISVEPLPKTERDDYHDHPYTQLPYPKHPYGVSPIFEAVWLGEERVALVGEKPGDGGVVRVWRPGSPEFEPEAWETSSALHAAALAPDRKTLAVAGNDQRVTFLDAATLEVRKQVVLGSPRPSPEVDPDAEFMHRLKRRGFRWAGEGPDPGADVEWSTDAYFPLSIEYHSGSGPMAVFSLVWASDGATVYAGTQGGVVLAIEAPASN